MAAEVKLDIDLSGWIAKCERIKWAVALMAATDARLEYAGQHSELHVSNARIAMAELDRAGGDKNAIFPLEDKDRERPAKLIAKRLKHIAYGAAAVTAVDALKSAIGMLRAAVYRNVLADRTTGPARSGMWNLYKAMHFNPPTPKMVATREWLNSLTAKVNGQEIGKARSGGGYSEYHTEFFGD